MALERLFKVGVSAYQEGDYERAVQAFSQLKSCKSSSYRTKANMGLVRVYMSQQNWQQAKALCQKVGSSSNPSLRQWSQTTLNKIAQQISAAKSVTATQSGFQPIDDEPGVAVGKAASGFQPLTPLNELSAPRKQGNQATVVAPPVSSQQQVPAAPLSGMDVSAKSAHAVVEQDASKHVRSKEPEAGVSEAEVSDGVSMFHYAYLNGEDAEPDDVQSPDVRVGDIALANSTEGFMWPYANRLDKGRTLGRIKRGQLWFVQIGGAIAFYILCRTLIHRAVGVTNDYLSFLDSILPFWVRSLPGGLRDVTWPLLVIMGVTLMASPWLWDFWLRFTVEQRTFSINSLRSHSAEAATLINRYCRQRRWAFPNLRKLPTGIPLIFSYGFLPRNARLVVSQGLLDQLNDEELAVLIAYEMSHWKSWHWPLLSTQTLILQVMLQVYWQLALWGNRQKTMIKCAVGAIATVIYSLFWMLRLPGLGMARVRTYYSDRKAAEITGNPNGLARALSKLSFGLAASVEKQGYTPILVEGLGPLLPAATDIARQQVYGRLPLAQLFAWDSQNPLRAWMSIFNSHPPLGDRLRLMMAYSQHWKLTPELQLAAPPRKRKGMSAQNWKQLWIHSAPYVGFGLGVGVGLLLLGVGAIAAELEWPALDWMHKDMGLFHFCWLLGVSVGNIMRMNRFFPDLSFSMGPSQDFADWVGDSGLLPASSVPTKLSGHLTGRPGVANWLGQDLMLQTSSGLIKLHFFSVLGPWGNFLNRQKTPRELTGQSVQILGWFRRGNRIWLDIDKIRLNNGTLIQAGHPLHSLLLAVIALLTGFWLLIRSSPYS